MPIADARRFLFDAMDSGELRRAINLAADKAAREAVLAEAGYRFNGAELEEAWRNELTRCQTEELAADLHGIFEWWRMSFER